MPAALLDIGINLTHESYRSDLAAVMERAAHAGVTRMIVTGSSVAGTHEALALVHSHPDVLRCTAGVHPHHASELDAAQLRELATLAKAHDVVAVGECGLDFFRNFSPREAQLHAFRAQLELARELRKPVFLHQRDAHDDFLAVLHDFRDLAGVAHCFTAGPDEARAYLDLGLHIGITGWICDERRGLHLREVVRMVPADRLLIETDGPYLLPRDLRPKPESRRNEPAYLPHILSAIAAARGETADSLAERTTQNALTLFGWK
jgi:TatD DNase family protein